MLTELTCKEPSLARVPWICTWCPSCGFRMELSPCRLTLWPLSAASTQFPPDCFRQPRMELTGHWCWWPLNSSDRSLRERWMDWLSMAAGWLGCCWSGVDEPELPVCANAMPAVSISAKINFLFMSLLLRYLCPSGLEASFPANVR